MTVSGGLRLSGCDSQSDYADTSDGDLEEQYIIARFRVWIDADQYQRLSAYIKERKAQKGPWNALFANCAIFGRDVASFLNLKMSPPAAMGLPYPQGMVEAIREANGLKHEQLPLRDAAGFFPREIKTNRQTKIQSCRVGGKQNCGASYRYRISAEDWRPKSIVQEIGLRGLSATARIFKLRRDNSVALGIKADIGPGFMSTRPRLASRLKRLRQRLITEI